MLFFQRLFPHHANVLLKVLLLVNKGFHRTIGEFSDSLERQEVFSKVPSEEAYYVKDGQEGPLLECIVKEPYRDRSRYDIQWTRQAPDGVKYVWFEEHFQNHLPEVESLQDKDAVLRAAGERGHWRVLASCQKGGPRCLGQLPPVPSHRRGRQRRRHSARQYLRSMCVFSNSKIAQSLPWGLSAVKRVWKGHRIWRRPSSFSSTRVFLASNTHN